MFYDYDYDYSDGDLSNECVEWRWGREKSQFSTNIWLYCMLSTFDRQVLYTQLHWTMAHWWHLSLVSVIICCSREMDDRVFMTRRLNIMPKTTEQNLIVRSGKSEAAITNIGNKRLRYCTVEANWTDRKHAASPQQWSHLFCLFWFYFFIFPMFNYLIPYIADWRLGCG